VRSGLDRAHHARSAGADRGAGAHCRGPVPHRLSRYAEGDHGRGVRLCQSAPEIPELLGLDRKGAIKLRELIMRTYRLDQIKRGYADLDAGKNLRGVVEFDH
jgi:hypothetical protein